MPLMCHILRLDVDRPAQKAMQNAMQPADQLLHGSRSPQKISKTPQNTTTSKPSLPKHPSKKLIEIAKDNVRWKQEIVRCMKRDL